MRGTPPQDLPEALDHLQLRTVTGEGIHLQMGIGGQDRVDQSPPMPGGLVDHDDHPRVVDGRVGPGHLPQMRRKAHLEMALLGGPWLLARVRPLDQTRRQAATDEIQGPKDVERVVTIEVADQGPVAFDAQSGAQRRDQGKAGFILAQQHEFPCGGFFFYAREVLRSGLLLDRVPFEVAIGGAVGAYPMPGAERPYGTLANSDAVDTVEMRG